MMLITREVAFQIESCIKQSHFQFTKQHLYGAVKNIGSGAAFFSGENSFFSQVIAWGFHTSEQQFINEIESIEDFYRQHNHGRVDIELSSLTGNSISLQLSSRGYVLSELSNISVLDLQKGRKTNTLSDADESVKQIDKNNLKDWAHCVASGFGCNEAWKQFYHYGQAKGVTCFGAFLDERLVAGGAIAIHNDICDLGITSTLPKYRGKGLQKALLSRRIDFAIQSGAQVASVTTEPGSISDLNIQKKGFQIAYTRLKFCCNMISRE